MKIRSLIPAAALLFAVNVNAQVTMDVLGVPYVPTGSVGGGLSSLAFDSSGNAYALTTDSWENNKLYSLNPVDGTGTLIVDMPDDEHMHDFAIQPGTNTLYGAYWPQLLTVDKETGVTVELANSLPTTPGGLAFAEDGTLYYIAGGNLYTLDPADGSVLTTIPVSNGYSYMGLGVQTGSGELYAAAHGGARGEIYRIDPATGDATFVEDVTNIGCAGSCTLHDIAFDPTSGIAYGVMGGNSGSIDPDDLPGAFVRFGGLPTAAVLPAPPEPVEPEVVPTLSLAWLFALGAGVLGMARRQIRKRA